MLHVTEKSVCINLRRLHIREDITCSLLLSAEGGK